MLKLLLRGLTTETLQKTAEDSFRISTLAGYTERFSGNAAAFRYLNRME